MCPRVIRRTSAGNLFLSASCTQVIEAGLEVGEQVCQRWKRGPDGLCERVDLLGIFEDGGRRFFTPFRGSAIYGGRCRMDDGNIRAHKPGACDTAPVVSMGKRIGVEGLGFG
ncbi:hypothetical protein [Pseudovibrio exalbescens]|uniref:hypothetical protein n=1 Tax=Pseudovibrio exalbescens TaxID=197461 RepID=UPI0011AF5F6B|nr:hypothetical protein [Pseudovibrio exalbescens]